LFVGWWSVVYSDQWHGFQYHNIPSCSRPISYILYNSLLLWVMGIYCVDASVRCTTRCHSSERILKSDFNKVYFLKLFSRPTNGFAYATMLRSSVVCPSVVCKLHVRIVAKRCVLPKNCMKKQIGNDLWKSNGHVTDDITLP